MTDQIDAIARVCHEANRAYCQTLGDHSQVAWDAAPDWQRNSARLGVRKILDGTITRPEQSHENWMQQKLDDGWVYGAEKDAGRKTHPCLVSYDQLPREQQVKDALFWAVVQALRIECGARSESVEPEPDKCAVCKGSGTDLASDPAHWLPCSSCRGTGKPSEMQRFEQGVRDRTPPAAPAERDEELEVMLEDFVDAVRRDDPLHPHFDAIRAHVARRVRGHAAGAGDAP